MRPVLALLCMLGTTLASLPAFAQRTPPSQEQLQELLEKKLAGPWLKQNAWLLDFECAQAEAKEQGKLIFGYFTRSYSGCVPCQVVEDGPFSQAEFGERFAGDVVLYANISSRVDGRVDDDLLARFDRNVHPTMLFFDAEGKIVGEHIAMGARNVRSFRASLADAKTVVRAQREPVGDDTARGAELLAAEIELGRLTFAQARERRAALGAQDHPLAERALEALRQDPWFENDPHDFIGEFVKRVAALPGGGEGEGG